MYPSLAEPGRVYHSIQTGSFASKGNAESQLGSILSKDDLRAMGFVRIERSSRYFIVRIGRYEKKSDAERDLARVKRFLPGALIVRLDSEFSAVEPRGKDNKPEKRTEKRLSDILEEVARSVSRNDLERGIKTVREGLKTWPGSHELYGWYGVILLRSDKPGKALPYFRKAISLSDKTPEYHNGAGYSLLYTGKTHEAVVEFKRSLKIEPRFVDSLAGLGYAYLKLGRRDDAISVYNRLKGIDGKVADMLFKRIMTE